jgi:hypothetical protein
MTQSRVRQVDEASPKQETPDSDKHDFVLCRDSLPNIQTLVWPSFISIVYLTDHEATPGARFGIVIEFHA